MDHIDGIPQTTATAPNGSAPQHRRSVADWLGLVLLSLLVLFVGGFTGVLGPLFAISCESCQDGIRIPLFDEVLLLIAFVLVPLTTFVSVVATFLPRGGARAGGIGLGTLLVLFVVMLAIGQIPA
ncbi:hypothetical protein [Streptomyces oceani]|uniref:Uncharacterized protein n=1 Tax=Streptomyces oceani TaxID=1075402 RepID=A0A1E7KGR5_9ACTN|nr:hypothetical protein [Streptomyces oceani]OEV03142.1 hypothetical protein AN216_13135 [Streptomyces oceani]